MAVLTAAAMMFLQGILAAMAAMPALPFATPEYDRSSASPIPEGSEVSPPTGSGPSDPLSRWRHPVWVPMELWVTDQSLFLSPANITVAVGGVEVVNGSFPVGSQHNFFGFHLMVSSVLVDAYESTTGARGHFEAFLKGTNYVVISFWWYPDRNEGPAFSFSQCPCID